MSLMKNLKTKDNLELDQDRLGGRQMFETDVYDATVTYAFLDVADSGAISINFQIKTEDGRTHNQTEYMTSGEKKGCKNTYTDSNGKEHYLPGFVLGNTLALLTVGEEIGDLDTDEKVINLYNREEKKELPTKVNMLVDMVGEQVKVAIEKQVVDKQVKNDAGKYVASGETREINVVTKVFRHRDGMTVTEIKAKAEEPNFMQMWIEKNKGQLINKAKGVADNGATKGAPKKADSAKSSVKSLFSK